jgi:CDP-diacylglycerol--glycerol-3-phosphate 3-phosphatidyltransferase
VERIKQDKILNVPNVLTMARIAALPFVIWRFVAGDRVGALVLYVLVVLTDLLDGYIARRYHKITNFGKLMDPLADKLLLLTMLILFWLEGTLPGGVVALVIAKELAMIAGGCFALSRGIVVHALPIGKAATVVFALAVITLLLDWSAVGKVLLGIAVVLMLCAMFYYLYNLIRMMGEGSGENANPR